MFNLSRIQATLWRLFWRLLQWPRMPPFLMLANPRKRMPSLSTSVLSDVEVLKLYRLSPRINHDPEMEECRPVALVAPDAIVKPGSELEAFNTDFVLSHTTIPLPICDRFFTDENRRGYLVMEYIPGRTLSSCWESLSWWTRFRVLVTLRDYVRQLRAFTHTVPGAVSPDCRPQKCYGPLFGEEAGPFEDYAALSAFYNRKLAAMKRLKPKIVVNITEPFDDKGPLVFTHLDLHMRNILLGDDGQLWIIDWDFAGFFPIWFEYAAMRFFEDRHPLSWNRWIPFMVGRWDSLGQYPFVARIGWALIMKGL